MQLDEFFGYKNKLMEHLLTNREIVRLIDEDVPFEDAASLAYLRVYPCEYIPDTVNMATLTSVSMLTYWSL